MSLPIFQTEDKDVSLLQTNWSAQLNPLLNNPANNSIILKNISLSTGSNTISHKLQRRLQGWKIIRQRAAASIYDDQDNNQMANLTLLLVSDAPTSVDLEVF